MTHSHFINVEHQRFSESLSGKMKDFLEISHVILSCYTVPVYQLWGGGCGRLEIIPVKNDANFQFLCVKSITCLFRPSSETQGQSVGPPGEKARLTAPGSPRMYLDMIMVEITAPT